MNIRNYRGYYPYWDLYNDMNSGWIYGYLHKDSDGNYCVQPEDKLNESYEVIEESIGQATGLFDKKGKEVFEKDIILWGDKKAREKGTAIYAIIQYRSGCFGIFDGERFHEFYHYAASKWGKEEITDDMWDELPISEYFRACIEVVGNCHENKDLLNKILTGKNTNINYDMSRE